MTFFVYTATLSVYMPTMERLEEIGRYVVSLDKDHITFYPQHLFTSFGMFLYGPLILNSFVSKRYFLEDTNLSTGVKSIYVCSYVLCVCGWSHMVCLFGARFWVPLCSVWILCSCLVTTDSSVQSDVGRG